MATALNRLAAGSETGTNGQRPHERCSGCERCWARRATRWWSPAHRPLDGSVAFADSSSDDGRSNRALHDRICCATVFERCTGLSQSTASACRRTGPHPPPHREALSRGARPKHTTSVAAGPRHEERSTITPSGRRELRHTRPVFSARRSLDMGDVRT